MPTPSHLIGVHGDECQCGRRATVRHCPSCGSSRVYARMNRQHTFLNGEKRFVEREFRCQSCDHRFVEEERDLCEAPPVGQKLAAQKVRAIYEAKQQGEYLNPKEVKIAKALDVIVGPTAQTEEQRTEADKKLDSMIRQVWADEVFAFKSGKQKDNPGPCEAYVARRKKEVLEQQA